MVSECMRFALELELKEKKIKAINEALELYAEYLKGEFNDFEEFVKDKYCDGCF